jgi:drug/metabolite transporter (DMT)-like permease
MAFVSRNVIGFTADRAGARHLGQHLYCDLAVPAAGSAVYRRAAAGAAGRDRSVDLESPFPLRAEWWKLIVTGILNIGAFQALLFIAAYRLPGGLAAVIAIQPLLVMLLAWCVDRQRSPWLAVLSALMGIAGMAMLLLSPQTTSNRWGSPPHFWGR